MKSNTPKLPVVPSGENLTPGLPNFHARTQPVANIGQCIELQCFLSKQVPGYILTFNILARRRTNPTKEVERLEKNREERKIRNAESREEKKTLMKKDPGNVNWEFSAMIKYTI